MLSFFLWISFIKWLDKQHSSWWISVDLFYGLIHLYWECFRAESIAGVDIRFSKVCELGLLNYKANNVFYPLERSRFRCRHDYYWASVFEVIIHSCLPFCFVSIIFWVWGFVKTMVFFSERLLSALDCHTREMVGAIKVVCSNVFMK